ncbi:MAG: MBOAT family protein [Lachnospiraceae bacterium]|nr:MBOAT family protein [Lachnospiraceae bacterium]
MTFSSLIFIFAFLPAALLLYGLVKPARARAVIMIIASLVFYAWGNPVYVILLILSVVFNYYIGCDPALTDRNSRSGKRIFICAVIVNLLILGFFKYYGFLVSTVNALLKTHFTAISLPLPLGLSFFTFKAIAWIADARSGKINSRCGFLFFAASIMMFPTISMGPIDRMQDIIPQMRRPAFSLSNIEEGLVLFLVGLMKKVLLADNIAELYNSFRALPSGQVSVLMAWLGMAAFAFQLYFDFSGYSDMAKGIALMFGIRAGDNFDHPYTAVSVTDFWRKWHISLSRWFRDYIYIPLGGNRVSVGRHVRNILVVWALTGLWHGAAWTYVAWGVYYGIVLLLEKYFLIKILEKLPRLLRVLYTMFIVVIGWVFFSSRSFAEAASTLLMLFGGGSHALSDSTGLFYLRANLLLLVFCFLGSTAWPYRFYTWTQKKFPVIAACGTVLLMLLTVAFMVYSTYQPFMYAAF